MAYSNMMPRIVLVSRPTELRSLLATYGTYSQVRFLLESRGQSIVEIERRHQKIEEALDIILKSIPVKWRRTHIKRDDLYSFVFEDDDLVVVVGQDGLVANVAKYLDKQLVFGVNADPERFEGQLVKIPPQKLIDELNRGIKMTCNIEQRTMVEVTLDDGQYLTALNELFIGHRSHQSARYKIRFDLQEERHSSSGVIVSSGTGSTGWASSIKRERGRNFHLPSPSDSTLAFFIREAWQSRWSQANLTEGCIHDHQFIEIVSEMDGGGVIFGDGIEEDRLEFPWGAKAMVMKSQKKLQLVTAS